MDFKIMPYDYRDRIRVRLGLDEGELSNENIDINDSPELAELWIKSRVPEWNSITSETELIYLKRACVSYACALIAPSLSNVVANSFKSMDISWSKKTIDWNKVAETCISDAAASLSNISSVDVVYEDYKHTLFGKTTNTYRPIGGEG